MLSKLLWVKQGSELSRRDVVAMLSRPQPLYMEHLRRTAQELGVAELLDALVSEAEKH